MLKDRDRQELIDLIRRIEEIEKKNKESESEK